MICSDRFLFCSQKYDNAKEIRFTLKKKNIDTVNFFLFLLSCF